MTVYKNKNYTVDYNAERGIYEVISLVSGAVEFEDRSQPRAMVVAYESSLKIDQIVDATQKQEVGDATNVVSIRPNNS